MNKIPQDEILIKHGEEVLNTLNEKGYVILPTDELSKEESVSIIQERKKCLTVNELIKELKDIRKIVGGEAEVLLLDSSGYDYDVTKLSIDHDAVIIS